MTIGTMGKVVVPEPRRTRQVIAVELQGHGHTADVDRPLSYEQMADDVAALLRHLEIEEADIFGYSMGGGVAFQVAIRTWCASWRPPRPPTPATASTPMSGTRSRPSPRALRWHPLARGIHPRCPQSRRFSTLVAKLKQLDGEPAWPPEAIEAIEAPTLLIIGDSDGTRPEHAVEMFRLLGGGVMGDLAGLQGPGSPCSPAPRTLSWLWGSWTAPIGWSR